MKRHMPWYKEQIGSLHRIAGIYHRLFLRKAGTRVPRFMTAIRMQKGYTYLGIAGEKKCRRPLPLRAEK